MALVSPGVQVTVIDQSNYSPTAVGTVAYVLLATAENKSAPGGTGIAPGTTVVNAEKIWTITSQRDLSTTFGDPIFKTTAGGSAINGDEQNEYGLLAAYSSLDVSNTMYVQRADVDLGELQGSVTRPLANPSNGSLWLDAASSNYGIFEWNYSTNQFTQRTPIVIASTEYLAGDSFTPNAVVGSIGDYAVNVYDADNPVFYKIYNNTWQLIGNTGWQSGIPSVTGTVSNPIVTSNANININGATVSIIAPANVTQVASTITTAAISGIFARVANNQLVISYANAAATSGNVNISNATGSALTTLGIAPGVYPAAATTFSPWNTVPSWQGQSTAANSKPTGSVWQKVSSLGNGVNMVVKEYNGASKTWTQLVVNSYANVFTASYNLDPTGGGINIAQGTVFNQYNARGDNTVASYLWRKKTAGATVATGTGSPSNPGVSSNFTLTTRPISTSANTSTYTVTVSTATINGFIQAVASANIPYVSAGLASSGAVTLTHSLGGDMVLVDGTGTPLSNVGLTVSGTNIYATPTLDDTAIVATNWQPLELAVYDASITQPYVAPTTGTLWYYNTPNRVDIMINNGSAWVGYKQLTADIRGYNLSLTNATGVILSTIAPTKQDDGVSSLVYGDLWLDTSDLENYPKLYRYQSVDAVDQWVAIDNQDTVSQNGIVFADARWGTSGTVNPALDPIPSITDMLVSSYVDLDAPSPLLYPRGMLLFNTRASAYNVKEYKTNYFSSANYPGEILPAQKDSWVTSGGFQLQGTIPNFGRKAPRGIVVAALKAAIDASTTIREDSYGFNLMLCPGYPELIPNMIALNNARENTAFIIGDTPLRLQGDGTSIVAWAQNQNNATSTGENGLVTIDPYVGLYYPQGQTNDLNGNTVVVPASHAALRTIIRSDNVGYPWLAPAGTRRGLIDNLNSIGYITQNSGQFISIGVNQGLRDVLYENQINPMTFLPGNGLLVYGQKTLSAQPSALDRINVARLVNYLRKQLNVLARPFLFEPNDPITRNAILAIVNSLLTDLVAKRGITDYLAVCDNTNNTPERITNNQLWIDIAVQPTKDVEFIYIPIRLKNPGDIQAGNLASAATVGAGA